MILNPESNCLQNVENQITRIKIEEKPPEEEKKEREEKESYEDQDPSNSHPGFVG